MSGFDENILLGFTTTFLKKSKLWFRWDLETICVPHSPSLNINYCRQSEQRWSQNWSPWPRTSQTLARLSRKPSGGSGYIHTDTTATNMSHIMCLIWRLQGDVGPRVRGGRAPAQVRWLHRQDGPRQPRRGLHRGHDAEGQAPADRPQWHQKQTDCEL